MGIKKLNSFILNKNKEIKYNSLETFVNTKLLNNKKYYKLAIDIWYYTYKFKYSINNIIRGFWNLFTRLLTNRIIPICVFDGDSPQEKEHILNTRANRKENIKERIQLLNEELNDKQNLLNNEHKVNLINQIKKLEQKLIYINKDDIDNIKELCILMNIPFIYAIGEADYMCAKLYKENLIDGCLSNDMDILTFGCYNLIKFNKKEVIEYNLKYILSELELTYEEFIDMCLLFGCDYIKKKNRMKPEKSFNLIKQYHCIENINSKFIQKNLEDFIKARDIFLNASNNEIIYDNFNNSINKRIHTNKLYEFLNNNMIFNKNIKYKINKINYLIVCGVFKL